MFAPRIQREIYALYIYSIFPPVNSPDDPGFNSDLFVFRPSYLFYYPDVFWSRVREREPYIPAVSNESCVYQRSPLNE